MGMLGFRIASLRKEAGLTQAALAERLEITASAVGMYEQGRREPPCDILIALSREFQVSLDYLMTGRENTRSIMRSFRMLFPGIEKMTLEDIVVLLLAYLLGGQ